MAARRFTVEPERAQKTATMFRVPFVPKVAVTVGRVSAGGPPP